MGPPANLVWKYVQSVHHRFTYLKEVCKICSSQSHQRTWVRLSFSLDRALDCQIFVTRSVHVIAAVLPLAPTPIHKAITNNKTMMKIAATLVLLLGQSSAFLAPSAPAAVPRAAASSTPLFAVGGSDGGDAVTSRRAVLSQTLAATTAALLSPALSACAEGEAAPSAPAAPTVVVAGATGQTGRRVLERLAALPNTAVVAGVRNVEKASKSLSESSTVVRGAMVQKVPSLDAAGVELRKLDGEFRSVRLESVQGSSRCWHRMAGKSGWLGQLFAWRKSQLVRHVSKRLVAFVFQQIERLERKRGLLSFYSY